MRIHLIGVGGISMRSLGRYLHDIGHEVSGCDRNSLSLLGLPEDPHQEQVRALLGFPIIHGHDAAHIEGVDQVIINSAITPSHLGWVEVSQANKFGIPVMKRAQKIGEITHERQTIAVTGTHGKSTTTGMAAHVALAGGLDPFVMIGATVPEFGNQTYRAGDGPLVLEADEFDRSFLQFQSQTAIVTTIEADHLDYYTGGLPEIIEVFSQFMLQVIPGGTLILNADDHNIDAAFARIKDRYHDRRVIRYGHREGIDYQIITSQLGYEKNQFVLQLPSGERVTVDLRVPGVFNQENATAVFAFAETWGIPLEVLLRALHSYRGVGVRFEIKARTPRTTIVLDYGHHPTELRVTRAATEAWFPDQPVTVVFQPHQYARTRLLFADFVEALASAHRVYITDIFGVAGREDDEPVSAEDLVAALKKRGTDALYVPTRDIASRILAEAEVGGVFLMIGAGLDIRLAAETVARELKAQM